MIYNGKLIKMTEYIRNTLVFLFLTHVCHFDKMGLCDGGKN